MFNISGLKAGRFHDIEVSTDRNVGQLGLREVINDMCVMTTYDSVSVSLKLRKSSYN